ncbi:MAG: DAK2 domain-containing protein [Anaerolineales bacterium]|nr:DAK2 domain-containing protein [Anaerolineales bacterium]
MNLDSQESAKNLRLKRLRESPIDGLTLKRLVEASLTWLRTNQEIVNSLNVFPVPDGDTGTNMVLTMQSAYDEIVNSPEQSFGKMSHAVANGALMGARGNSGVILSQIWRGIAHAAGKNDILDASTMAQAFASARDTAYKGVVRPVEGTILTVIKDSAAAAAEALTETDDPYKMLELIVTEADESVQRTPELLPVLKEAGVVDSGGIGLFYILEGMLRYSNGLPLDSALTTVQPLAAMQLENTLQSIEPGQDFEVVVDFRPDASLDLEGFYRDLEMMGTSIQVGEGDGIYRMHIHVPTEKRYEPIDYTMSLGTITKVAIENLLAQMEEIENASGSNKLALAPVEPGQIAVVAVSPGPGLTRVFASLGVAAIVEGGQTMNPSTKEIINAIENLPTDNLVILPNNKNIIMCAESAAELTVKNVSVIPSRTIPQGISAMMRLVPDGDLDQVTAEMMNALNEIESGEITTATRSVEIDDVQVQEGQTIALLNGKLVAATQSVEEACLELLKNAHADHFELITLFYGEGIPKSEVNRIADIIRRTYPEQEIEVQEGGQPHYQFIIAIE